MMAMPLHFVTAACELPPGQMFFPLVLRFVVIVK
jgi:hypothetical protein